MADAKAKDGVVIGGVYKESDTHVPNPTDMYGALNTSGVGANEDLAAVSPIFAADRKAVAADILRALNPKDNSVSDARLLFSDDPEVDHAEEAKALKALAKAALANPVEVGGPTAAEKDAALKGEDGTAAAEAQERVNAENSGALVTNVSEAQTPSHEWEAKVEGLAVADKLAAEGEDQSVVTEKAKEQDAKPVAKKAAAPKKAADSTE